MPTISTPGYPDIVPLLVTGYEATRTVRSIVHGSIDPAASRSYVSLLTAGPRTGTLVAVFVSQDDAQACFDRHALPLVHTFAQPLVHVAAMEYITGPGDLLITLDDATQACWLVSIPYTEVG